MRQRIPLTLVPLIVPNAITSTSHVPSSAAIGPSFLTNIRSREHWRSGLKPYLVLLFVQYARRFLRESTEIVKK